MKWLKKLFLLIPVLVFSAMGLSAQDRVYMLNGDEAVGSVTAINGDDVSFIYDGESLNYTFKASDIQKIVFASGRTQVFNEPSAGGGDAAAPAADLKNTIAVMQFTYIGQGGSRDEKLEKKTQSDCYNILLKKAKNYKIQDPVTTNALLFKQGINHENIEGFTPAELAGILGVEYIIMGTITLNTKGATSTGGNYHSDKTKGNKTSGYAVGSATTSTNYSTNVDMKVYNESGENIFAKSHESFWDTEDAYEITLNYLIKRTPFYEK